MTMTLAPVCDAEAPIARVNPVAKLAAAFAVSITALIAADWLTPLLLLTALTAAIPFTGIRLAALARRLRWLWLAAAAVVVVNAVFAEEQTGQILIAFGPLEISTGALLGGTAIGLRVCVAATVGVLCFATTDPTDLADALTQQLRAPARFTLGALAALRLLPLLNAEWHQIAGARRARGLEGGWNPVRRLCLFASTMFALLVAAIRRAGRLAAAMDARGFDSEIPRTYAREQRMFAVDWVAIVAALLVCGTAITVSVAYGVFTAF
jgi:energy-coupling factor transport system permease protein